MTLVGARSIGATSLNRLTTTMDSVGTNSYTYTSGGFVALCRCLPYPSAVAISSP